jgi:hypothetical protein
MMTFLRAARAGAARFAAGLRPVGPAGLAVALALHCAGCVALPIVSLGVRSTLRFHETVMQRVVFGCGLEWTRAPGSPPPPAGAAPPTALDSAETGAKTALETECAVQALCRWEQLEHEAALGRHRLPVEAGP